MFGKRVCLLAVLAMGLAIGASGEVITFQQGVSPTPDYAGTADAHIISWDGEGNQLERADDGSNPSGNAPQNTGAHCYFEEGDYNEGGGSDDSKVMLIKFDISDHIPEGAVVGNAQIGVFYRYERATAGAEACGGGNSGPADDTTVEAGRSNPHSLQVQRVLKDWAEGEGGGYDGNGVDGVDAPDNSGAVTWNSTGYELWEAIGAEGPSDVTMPISSTWFVPDPKTWVWFDVTEAAQYWVDNPDENYGVKISQETDNDPSTTDVYVGGAYNFVASENDIDPPTTRPKLVVEILESSSAGQDWTLYK